MLVTDITPDTKCPETARAGRWHLPRFVAHHIVTMPGRLVARDTHQTLMLARCGPQRLRAPRRGESDRDSERCLACTRLRHVESTYEPVGAAH
ncbi:hypothetical protein LY15_003169 [Prauserella flava]|nr:hypothetical protein [Prauserella flava]MCR3734737.1 hypothetical protein [Prauserella salsuginis]